MIGSGELIVILCVLLVLFGGKKLPDFARNLGKGIREFKKACQGIEEEEINATHIEKDKCAEKEQEPNDSRRP